MTRQPLRLLAAVLFFITTVGLVVGRWIGWLSISWLEILAALTGAACVALVLWRNVWNFPVGIVSCIAYLVIFAEGRLYAESGLQVVFILLSIHGWIAWSAREAGEVRVRRVPVEELTVLAFLFPAIWLGLTRVLEYFGGASPTLDAFATTLSLVAQWLLNRRHIENWLAWIVVDQVSIALFWSREMYLTAVLYAIFLAMCIAGLLEWRRQWRSQSRPELSDLRN
jgi:nicotinamide mononucleotide transporter